MRFLALLAVPLLTGIAVADVTQRPDCKCEPREAGQSGSKVDYPLGARGIRWHRSIEEAKAIAAYEGKLVFYFHVAGDLDKEGC